MPKNPNKINALGLFAKADKKSILACQQLIEIIQTDFKDLDFLVDSSLKKHLNLKNESFDDIDNICQQVDLLFSVGGDGTLIQLAHSAIEYDLPIVGINAGRLGYLADIPRKLMKKEIYPILQGEYVVEERLTLQAKLNGNIPLKAINEILFHRKNLNRMIDFEITINGNWVIRQKADGLICNTPTGSTAYALSSGGPILSTQSNAIGIVAICSHTLSFRPLVINDNSIIEIVVHNPKINECIADGSYSMDIHHLDKICIKKYPKNLLLAHPIKHDEFSVLRNKLNWG